MIVAVTMFAFSHSVQAQGTQGILNASQSMLGGTTQRRNLAVDEIDSIFRGRHRFHKRFPR
jgi:hypothetical protein